MEKEKGMELFWGFSLLLTSERKRERKRWNKVRDIEILVGGMSVNNPPIWLLCSLVFSIEEEGESKRVAWFLGFSLGHPYRS